MAVYSRRNRRADCWEIIKKRVIGCGNDPFSNWDVQNLVRHLSINGNVGPILFGMAEDGVLDIYDRKQRNNTMSNVYTLNEALMRMSKEDSENFTKLSYRNAKAMCVKSKKYARGYYQKTPGQYYTEHA